MAHFPRVPLVGWLLAVCAATLLFQLVACSVVVDTGYLTAGKDGLDCSSNEKVCPVSSEEPDGIQECVNLTSIDTGCAKQGCSPCQLPGAVARCMSNGECGVAVCREQNQDCDGDETNGCEIDTASDIDNCGACGRVCSRNNAVTACVRGICEFVICAPPFADCDGDASNGCETDLRDDADHCGECNRPCENGCAESECID